MLGTPGHEVLLTLRKLEMKRMMSPEHHHTGQKETPLEAPASGLRVPFLAFTRRGRTARVSKPPEHSYLVSVTVC